MLKDINKKFLIVYFLDLVIWFGLGIFVGWKFL